MTSNLSAFPYFQEREEATPAAFNDKLSIISANIAAVGSQFTISPPSGNTVSISTNLEVIGGAHFQHLSIGSTPPSYLTTAAVTIEVNSAFSDYLYMVDSSAQKSSYIIGSRAGGTADGLNIWDASAGTMIASFSKQSIRFFQNVVGPVFDVGGALADTINAATFGTGADSVESRIQAAISAATTAIPTISRVYVPANMYPYSAASVSFDTRVQMVREGGNWAVFDVQAYGAYGNNTRDDAAAFRGAVSAATWVTGTVFIPNTASGYKIGSTVTLSPNIDIGGGSGYQPTITFSGASGHLFSFLGTAEAQAFNTRIHNMTLLNGTSQTGVCLRLRNFQNAYIDQLGISSWSIGIWGDFGIGLFIDKCSINNTKRGVYAGGVGLAGGISSNVSAFMDSVDIDASVFAQNKYDIVHNGSFTALGIMNVRGSTFFESGGAPVSGKTQNVHVANLKGANFIGNWFENPIAHTAVVYTNVDSDGTAYSLLGCRGGVITGNHFLGTAGAGFTAVHMERAGGVCITGNDFEVAAGGIPVNLSERTTACYVIANNYLLWSDNTTFPNPVSASTNSLHLILEPSNMTSSINTVIIRGRLSVGTGTSTIPAVQFGSDTTIGFYMPAAGTVNWNGAGMGIRQTGGLAATFDVNGTIFCNNSMHITGPIRAHQAGSAILPSYAISSETSLGWYRSGSSTMALSYGTIDLTASGAVTSIASLTIKSGSNNACGTAVLGSNGSVNVANTYVKTGDLIFLTDQTPGGTLGDLEILGIRNSSGFTIGSTSVTDTSTVAWLIVRPG